jgi:hypothetical protein
MEYIEVRKGKRPGKELLKMFHYIDHIVKASDEALVKLAQDARRRAKNGTLNYQINQELIAEACELELELRKEGIKDE